jgi:hypothetical protein
MGLAEWELLMARSRTTYRRGHRGAGGRPKGALNRATVEIRAFARGLLEDPAYIAALRRRLLAGTAGQIELLLFGYAYGRATDSPVLPTGANRPASSVRGASDTAAGLDLSKEGREKLLALVESARAHLEAVPTPATPTDPEP